MNISRTFAFADGLTRRRVRGDAAGARAPWTKRFKRAEGLPVDLLAARLPDEQRFFNDLAKLTWAVIDTMFSDKVVKPGVTRTSDLVWYFRQR